MVWGDGFIDWFRRAEPEHLRRGRLGERAAKRHLKKAGLKFLYANYRTTKGEIELISTARNYLRLLHNPEIAYRFDIVEVLLNHGAVNEIRHQPNAFAPGRR
jgi:Holliday junction resolvase-like predicted endonuclease